MSKAAKALSRRHFLLAAGAGGAATAAAILAKNKLSGSQTKVVSRKTTRGYQASEHINNYYRTTKV